MSIIQELLADLLARSSEEASATTLHGPHIYVTKLAVAATQEAATAIVDPWNAAEKAMHEFVSDNFWQNGDEWQCDYCTAANDWHEDWHTPGRCHLAAQQAALALMERDDVL